MTLPPYTFVRYRARLNPLTTLLDGWESTLEGVDGCLISHVHFGLNCDHLDGAGVNWLVDHGVPVYCRAGDVRGLRKRGLDPQGVGEEPVTVGKGTIRTVHAAHGRGVVGKMMGAGVGYLVEFPGEPLVYLTGDTVLTDAVLHVLETHQPGVCIVPGSGETVSDNQE